MEPGANEIRPQLVGGCSEAGGHLRFLSTGGPAAISPHRSDPDAAGGGEDPCLCAGAGHLLWILHTAHSPCPAPWGPPPYCGAGPTNSSSGRKTHPPGWLRRAHGQPPPPQPCLFPAIPGLALDKHLHWGNPTKGRKQLGDSGGCELLSCPVLSHLQIFAVQQQSSN